MSFGFRSGPLKETLLRSNGWIGSWEKYEFVSCATNQGMEVNSDYFGMMRKNILV
jgi:hypothetical protein